MESLARASAARPWRTVVIWLVFLAGAVVVSSQLLGDALTTEIAFTNEPDSARAEQLIEDMRGDAAPAEFVVVDSETLTVTDPAYVDYVERLQTALGGSDAVDTVGSYLTEDGSVSESGIATLLPVTLAGADADAQRADAEAVHEVVAGIEPPSGVEALVAGPSSLSNEFNEIAEEDLATGETVGVGVALVVLVFVFGTIAAGVIPIILGVVAIATAMGLAALVGQLFDLSFFITNMVTMIGLAVGIDYSLFIVSRYREERRAGFDKIDAIARTGATATRAVVFSGLTVVLALVGMLLVPNTMFRSLGFGAILVVIAAVAASVTLLPAVLSLMGDRINSLRVRRRASVDSRSSMWGRVTRLVMGRPVTSLLVSAGVLLVAAASFLSIETGQAGVSTLPDESEPARAFAVLETEFSGGLASPVEIGVTGDDTEAVVAELAAAIETDGGFGPATVDPRSAPDVGVLSVRLPGDVASTESMDLVRHLRSDIVPVLSGDADVFVGGRTARTVDFNDQTSDYTPWVLATVLGLSFVLLMVAFRSVVIPAKAIVMNLLSVGAAYGLLVVFFQEGVGPAWVKDVASVLGFSQVETIENWIPLFLFSVLFGLSMDYHVFLLSRIKERFDITGDNAESVAYGLATTGSLITGAAAIMVAVFAGFAAGRLVTFQQVGFGLAVAVFLDATIVRTILVPASMRLLGDRNWYLPSWLQWIPNISVEGHVDDEPAKELAPVTA